MSITKIENKANIDCDFILPVGTEPLSKESNRNDISVISNLIDRIKASNKTFIRAGEIAVQTITITNNLMISLTDLFLTDTMSAGASYVAGSVKINGVSKPELDMSTGFSLEDIQSNQTVEIEYQIIADDPLTQESVENIAKVNFTILDSIAGGLSFETFTNNIELQIISTILDVVKSADREYVAIGDNIKYTITITNNGTETVDNIVFTDAIPAGTKFVENSVEINNVSDPSKNPETGFPLEELTRGKQHVVTFSVVVI